MANVRFGARFTTSAEKDLAYLQLQKDNDADFARAGELFINEPLEKIYFCDSVSGLFKELNPDPPALTTADKLESQTVPVSPTDTCTAGQIAWSNTHFYICTATDTWRRAAIDGLWP